MYKKIQYTRKRADRVFDVNREDPANDTTDSFSGTPSRNLIADRLSLISTLVAKIRHTIERVVWISSEKWRFGVCSAVSSW